jgi:hypothetical protein
MPEPLTQDQINARLKLVNAWRSGEYFQTRGALKKGGCFCAMGVAFDLLDPDGWFNRYADVYRHKMTDKEFKERYGFNDTEVTCIIQWNDWNQIPFLDIAKAVETWTMKRTPEIPEANEEWFKQAQLKKPEST